jgi:thymidylate synthase (FAD)
MALNEPMDIQETSMRYMDPFDYGWGLQPIEFRKRGKTNRQSSEEPLTGDELVRAIEYLDDFKETLLRVRDGLKEMDVSDETLRNLYPQATTTRFFINGTCRSWIHYFQQRLDIAAQLEHRQVAQQAYAIFEEHFPTVCDVLSLGDAESA